MTLDQIHQVIWRKKIKRKLWIFFFVKWKVAILKSSQLTNFSFYFSFLYRLPYDDIFGGVSAMTVDQFRQVNGFSNMFWGWGGEDDDMSNRLRQKKLYISRYPANIARYLMLKHNKDKANPDRFKYLYSGAKRIDKDGYNSLKYKPVKIVPKRLFTWILVDLPHLTLWSEKTKKYFSSSPWILKKKWYKKSIQVCFLFFQKDAEKTQSQSSFCFRILC